MSGTWEDGWSNSWVYRWKTEARRGSDCPAQLTNGWKPQSLFREPLWLQTDGQLLRGCITAQGKPAPLGSEAGGSGLQYPTLHSLRHPWPQRMEVHHLLPTANLHQLLFSGPGKISKAFTISGGYEAGCSFSEAVSFLSLRLCLSCAKLTTCQGVSPRTADRGLAPAPTQSRVPEPRTNAFPQM